MLDVFVEVRAQSARRKAARDSEGGGLNAKRWISEGQKIGCGTVGCEGMIV